jgi:putative membrane protein insertion efficiency factor
MSETRFTQIPGKFFIALVRAYQIGLSPFLLPCCRFYPSCSEFAIDAIRRYGPLKGSGLALLRLLRCHPWHPGGYDPVK